MNVICNGALCEVLEENIIPSGTENYFTTTFIFDSSWNSLTKEAIFISENIEKVVSLISNTCFIPKELSEYPGNIWVGVVGKQIDSNPTLIDETIILTTNRTHLCVVEPGPNLTIDEIKQRINLI